MKDIQLLSATVGIWSSYRNKENIARVWLYPLKLSTTPFCDSWYAILLRFCSSPHTQRVIGDCQRLSAVYGTNMSQLEQRGWGHLTSFRITIVCCTWKYKKCTRRLALLAPPPPPPTCSPRTFMSLSLSSRGTISCTKPHAAGPSPIGVPSPDLLKLFH